MDKEKLNGLVFIREPIWNKREKNYHNCILNKLWNEIANECDVPVATAKAIWKRLRQTFIQKLSEETLKRFGDAADDAKGKWAFFDSLLFLKDTCTPRATEGNSSIADNANNTLSGDADGSNLSDVAAADVDDDDGDDSSSQLTVSEPAFDSRPASSMSTSTPIFKKAKIQRISGKRDVLGESLIRVEEEKMEYLRRKEEYRQKREKLAEANKSRKEIDEDESFFNSILPHDASSKIQFRISVLQLVQKYLSQHKKTMHNHLVNNTEPHFTGLPFQQNILSTSSHYFPQNEFYNPGNRATYPAEYNNPRSNNHFEN